MNQVGFKNLGLRIKKLFVKRKPAADPEAPSIIVPEPAPLDVIPKKQVLLRCPWCLRSYVLEEIVPSWSRGATIQCLDCKGEFDVFTKTYDYPVVKARL